MAITQQIKSEQFPTCGSVLQEMAGANE